MRVLIADDDAAMCALLHKVVHSLGDVETVEARSGDDAAVLASEEEFDLVLLDWDMPGKTGVDLVRELRVAGSQVPIVMITGTSERARVVEAVTAGVSDFVVKPFAPKNLRDRIQQYWHQETPELAVQTTPANTAQATLEQLGSAVSLFADRDGDQEQLDGAIKVNLHSVVRRIDELSTLPDIAVQAMAVANDSKASASELREVLEADPGITSRVLRAANSAAVAASRQVVDLQQAITLLGLTQVRQLILTAAVSDLFKTKGGINAYRRLNLWRHMVAVGLCARMIARRLNFADDEGIFLAGLMHDIGIILEDQYVHPQFCKIIRGVDPEKTLIETEREYLLFDHTILGETMATRWGFPQIVRSAIRYHHNSMLYDEYDKLPVRCVELANMICSCRGITSVGTNLVRSFDPEAGALNLSPAKVAELAQELDHELARHQTLLHL